MAQHPVEVILMRQLASHLATPVFLVDPSGNLVYYNEPAEAILGHRFEETGEVPSSEWSTVYVATADDGSLVPPEELPLMVALARRIPAHSTFSIRGLDGISRRISVTAFPLLGQGDALLGGVAIFWEERATP